MAFLACILPVVSWICQPVMSGLHSFLQTGAQDGAQACFSFLTNLVVGRVNAWRGDFEEVPVSATAVVGAEETLSEILAHLNDDSVGIIGIYGMGGVGKTTLLSTINNDLCKTGTARRKFELGIWVTVSREVSIPEIQKQIAKRLNLIPLSGDEKEAAETLFKALSQRPFLLFLDDLWRQLDLVKVGIPVPNSQRNCKIVFTTRFRDVCADMDATKCVKVKPLDDGSSWELFCSKVGTEVDLRNNSPIHRLAKQVFRKCGGLPLALITVGKAMANKTDPREWKQAVKDLDKCADRLRGVEDKVLSCLKLSYDYLKNDNMRSALLFCAMYPEDREIDKDQLIEHWIGEGIIDDDDVDDGIDDARNRGCGLLTELQHSCLLEAGIHNAETHVRMHDAVRDLALWLSRTEYEKVAGFVTGEDLSKVANTQRREHVRRIYMFNLDLTASPPSVQDWPPNSWTLLLNHSTLEPCLLRGIINTMRTLRVLDLGWARHLEELPIEIGLLEDLKYLNLGGTNIRSLPKELGKLVRLRCLDLSCTRNLRRIPREAIVGLLSLQVLYLFQSRYHWMAQGETPAMEVRMVDDEENKQYSSSDADAAEGSGGRQVEVRDLEGLKRLQELSISLKTRRAWEQFQRSESLQRCTRYDLQVEKIWEEDLGEDGPLRMAFTKMGGSLRRLYLGGDKEAHPWVGDLWISLDQLPCLEDLQLYHFNSEMTTTTTIVLEGTNAVKVLGVSYCKGWKELKLLGKFPRLVEIWVDNCGGMEEVLLDDDNDGTGSQQDTAQEQLLHRRFPMLSSIQLVELTDLKSIGRRPLFLPSLRYFRVFSCPQLRRLPLVPASAPNLREIEGQQEWWDALEWGSGGDDDPNIRNFFAPLFIVER